MKRFLCALLSLVMVACLFTSCGDDSSSTNKKKKEEIIVADLTVY